MPDLFMPGSFQPVVSRWLFLVEQYLLLSHVAPAEWTSFTGTLLRGSAITWWQSIYTSVHTWDQFKQLFTAAFQPVNPELKARDRLAALKQLKSVQEYAACFRDITQEIPDLSTAEKMDRFKRGLKSSVRMEVELRDCTTLEEMIHVAERYDAIHFAYKAQFPRSPSLPFAPSLQSSSSATFNLQEPAPMDLDMVEKGKKPVKTDVVCFKSGKKGHVWRFCRERSNRPPLLPTPKNSHRQ
ncbi:unnamed protein product [Closterium sp. NIES-53]